MVNLTFYPEPMKLAGIRMTKELIINNKKLLIEEHKNKISIDVENPNYKKKIVITDDDIKVFN